MVQSLEKYPSGSDHRPIITSINLTVAEEPSLPPKPQWKKADWKRVNDALAEELSPLAMPDNPQEDDIDRYLEFLVHTIHTVTKAYIPHAKPSEFAKPY